MINRKLLLASTVITGAVATSCTQSQNQTESKPNVIVFLTDDQGYADLGCYGAEGFETPNIDNLAKDGIKFTSCYAPASVSTPSRAGLLTGRYPKKAKLHKAVLFPFSENGLEQKEYTMGEMFKSVGYKTHCIGKWHLGHHPQYMPLKHGFDDFYGVPYSNDMHEYNYAHVPFQSPPLPVYRNEKQVDAGPDQHYLTKMYTEEAVKIIKESKKDEPFFMYLAHNMPHNPIFASENFEGKSKLGLWGDVIMEIDWSMGEIIKELKKQGLYENTIIVFSSDNGPRKPNKVLKGSAKPLRGYKTQTWEGGMRVPGIVTWPARIPKNTISDQMISFMDLLPSFETIVGAKTPANHQYDGKDVSQHFLNPKTAVEDKPFFYYAKNGKLEAVRKGDWKLHVGKHNYEIQGEFPISLYNLKEDIGEANNLAEAKPEMVKELQKLVDMENNKYNY
jgi:arylsulfatase A-like enzyme